VIADACTPAASDAVRHCPAAARGVRSIHQLGIQTLSKVGEGFAVISRIDDRQFTQEAGSGRRSRCFTHLLSRVTTDGADYIVTATSPWGNDPLPFEQS
jgi:hypothetical protein